ncbi:tetratricopeptide repeat protein [Sphingomonas suaedae]|uniref:tetratricopeptide repeat protein n=1 Tax=Sphingomonas suaedae TaxID=2599297 RepID=UPI001EF0DC6D|nr:tetratricopeptide repeat protein [Sphingomonas suaedae]
MSDAASRDDAFVLWMARDRAEQLTRQQTSLRTKFSVHTLHFGHPRRGSGVSLRRHQIAIDLVARKFGIAGKAADWEDCASDVDQLLMQEAAALLVSAGDGQIRLPDDHMGDCDLKDVKAILGLGSVSYPSLVRESTDPQSFGHELTLLSTLDLDADVFAWLLSKDSNDFASAVRNAPRTTGPADANANAQKLIAEYLHKLDQKIVTAALRVEIRELGREKNRFFLDRATPVQPRSVTIADEKDKHLPMVRHISAEAGLYAPPNHCRELMLDEMVIRPAGWRQFDISPDRFTNAATFIVGAVGCGKGAFLRLLLEQCKPRIGTQGNAIWSSALFVNCCFGQEFDSVLSLVEEFLDPDRRIRTDEEPARSRRDRIETALDDLGANRGPRLLIAFGAIDRLFGLEGELLSTDCHWLFKALIRCRRIDLVVTGSEKVLPYIARRKREYLKRKGHNPSRFRMFEVSRSKSSVAAMVGSTSAQTDASEPNEGNDGTQAGQSTLAPAISFIGQLRKQGRERDRKARNLNVRFGVHEDVAADDVDDDALESMRLSGGRRDRLIIEREIDGLMRDDAGKPTNRDFGTLAQEILKVLAFIGLPVEGEVLITPPGVRNQVDILTRGKLKEDKSSSNLAIKDGVFLAALDLLLSRKLVTTIEPYGFRPAEPFEAVEPDASKGVADVNRILHEIDDGVGDRPVRRSFPIDKKGRTPAQHAILHRHRFALHRSILAYVRSRHDVPIGETTLSDCFNMTLFVAQPDDIPTPRPQLASELAELVDWLQRGWKDVELSKSRITDEIVELKKGIEENYYGDPRNPTRERRLRELVKLMQMRGSLAPASLRAAGGIVRSFFSAATLFGLDVTDMHGRLTPAGAITAHKQRIREMLNAAFLMQSAREPQCDKFQKAWNDHLVSRVTIPNPVSSGSDLNHEYEMFDTNQREKLDTILEFFSETQPWSDARPESEKWKTTRYCDHAIVPRWARMAGVAQASPQAVFGSAAPSNDLARRPFYADEVAWMHNERAVMALGQGDLYSAQTSFHLALQANEAIEGTEYQPNRCRILLNKALVQIERGRIREAWHELKRLRNAIDPQKPHRPNSVDPDTLEHGRIFWLATGYMGLCEHLNGQVDLARDSYDAALKWLIAHGEHRAVAMFSMHRASLLQSGVGDYDGAMEGYRIALAAAESGPHADLAYLIQVSRTGLQVSKLARRLGKAPTPEEPLEMLSRAIRYGELLDMYRVTAFARNVRAALRLDLGDVEAAEIDIARALAIAARCGMKLRRISLRLLKGRAYTIRGSLDNARLMYQTALSEAEVHGYQQGIHQARDGLKRVLSSGQLEKLER